MRRLPYWLFDLLVGHRLLCMLLWLLPLQFRVRHDLPQRLLRERRCLLGVQRCLHHLHWLCKHGLLRLRLGQLPLGYHLCHHVPHRHLHQRVQLCYMRHWLHGLQWCCQHVLWLLVGLLPVRLYLRYDVPDRIPRLGIRVLCLPLQLQHLLVHVHVHCLRQRLFPLQRHLLCILSVGHLPVQHDCLHSLQRQLRHLLGLCHDMHRLHDHRHGHASLQQRMLRDLPQRHVRLVFLGLHRLHLALRQLHVCLDHRLHQLRVHPAASLWDDLLHHVPLGYVRLQLDAVLQLHRALLDLLWIGHLVPVLRLWHLPVRHDLPCGLPRRLLYLWHFLRPVLLHVRQLHHHGHDLHQLPQHRIDPPLLEHLLCHLPVRHVRFLDVCLLPVLFTLRQLLDHSDDLHHLHSHLPPLLRDDQLMLLGLPCWRVRFQLLGMLDLQHQLRHLFGLKHDLPDLCLWHATVQQRLLQLMPGWHVQLVLHPVLGLHVSLLQLYIWVQHCLHRLRLEPALALWFHLLRVVPLRHVQ